MLPPVTATRTHERNVTDTLFLSSLPIRHPGADRDQIRRGSCRTARSRFVAARQRPHHDRHPKPETRLRLAVHSRSVSLDRGCARRFGFQLVVGSSFPLLLVGPVVARWSRAIRAVRELDRQSSGLVVVVWEYGPGPNILTGFVVVAAIAGRAESLSELNDCPLTQAL